MCADHTAETLLNLYIDGELPLDRQGELHAHLAACAGCRVQFNALMAFRLAVRQDPLTLPPAADERFLARLDGLRRARTTEPPPQVRPRRLLRARVKTQALAVAAVLAVIFGAWLATPPPPVPVPEPEPPDELIIQLPAVTVESVVTPVSVRP